MRVNVLLLSFVLMLVELAISINPYHVLQLEQGATQQKIRQQYKTLRKHAKNNHVKLQLYKDAYQQIMIDSTLQMTLPKQSKKPKQKPNRRNRRRRRGLPRLSDMFRHDYLTPSKQKVPQKSPSQRAFQIQDEKNLINEQKKQSQYRLPPEFDDPSYYQTKQKVQQTIKDQNVAFNIKAAKFILFIGGILLKLAPCFCLYMIYKYRKQDPRQQENTDNPITKAINGWSGRGRRIGGGKKVK